MARLTTFGIAMAVATLLVTMGIVSGFGDTYQRALLNFHAHLVVVNEGEFHGTAARAEALGLLAPHRAGNTPPPALDATALTRIATWWQWGIAQYDRLAAACVAWPVLGRFLDAAHPARQVIALLDAGPLPASLRAALQRSVQSAERGIVETVPFLYREGLLVGAGRIRGVALKGIDPEALAQNDRLRIALVAGETTASALAPRDDRIPVIAGVGFHLAPDASVQLFLPGTTDGGKISTHRLSPVRIVGTFESGLHDYDAQFLLVGLPAMQQLLHAADRLTGFELRLDDPMKAPWIAEALRARLPPGHSVMPWQEMHQPILEAVILERLLFGLIMGILVIVAAFNILATILLRVLKEHRSVAILRAMGLSNRGTRRRYFWRGMRTSAGGVGWGLLLGYTVATGVGQFHLVPLPPEIYFLSYLPVTLSLSLCAIVALFGLAVCALAAHHAARKVTDLPLLEALGRSHG